MGQQSQEALLPEGSWELPLTRPLYSYVSGHTDDLVWIIPNTP